MALQAAICTQCGAQIQVDESKEAGICPNCGTAFITEKVIHQFVTQNNFAGATINVQGGVDIENLYTLARRAVDANNKDDVLRYYGQIRERNPDDWEATFFYAWFENAENFNKYFKISEDLILKLETAQQIEALHRMNAFFTKIYFTLEYRYESDREKSNLPLKNEKIYYDFVMKFFDEKNPYIINKAQYLTNYLPYWGGIRKFYLEILSRQDKLYAQYLLNYRNVLYLARGISEIKEVESNIEKLNSLLDSEEDKKNNYLEYYKWFIEEREEYLFPERLKYLEEKIKQLDSSYVVPNTARKAARKNLREEKSKKRGKFFNIFTSVILVLLSIICVIALYNFGHPVFGTLSLIVLIILNTYANSYSDEKVKRIIFKIGLLFVLCGIVGCEFDDFFNFFL